MLFFKKKEIPLHEFFPKRFVDMHSHLLPGIDDGAKDLDTSIALIQKIAACGIKNIITTPHVLGDVYPNTPEIIKRALKEVRAALQERNITDITIDAAAEYMLDEQFSAILEKDKLLTLKDNYILVEMSYFNAPINLYELLFEIQLKGYKPVLAHPERYNFYHHDMKQYYKLKTAGCLFQLNLLSLTEHYGKQVQKTAEKLLQQNMYDFVGTDTHHEKHLDIVRKVSTKKNKNLLESIMQKNIKSFG
jgi:protein-tyrosine phosphatase